MAEVSELSKPVLAWRKKNMDEGLRSVTAWLPVDVKHHLEDLASQRRQTIGEVIADALNAWQPGTSTGYSSHLEQLIQKEVAKQLKRQQPPSHRTSPPPLAVPQQPALREPVAVPDQSGSPAPTPAPDSVADMNEGADTVPDYDETKFYLGLRPCPKGHTWGDTGRALLRKKNQSCRQCDIEHKRRKRQPRAIE